MSMKFVMVINYKMPTKVGIYNLFPEQMALYTVFSKKIVFFVSIFYIYQDYNFYTLVSGA